MKLQTRTADPGRTLGTHTLGGDPFCLGRVLLEYRAKDSSRQVTQEVTSLVKNKGIRARPH